MNEYGGNRWRIIIPRLLVLIIFGVLILRVGYLQLIDSRYESLAGDNYLRYVVKYPPRGEVFDRNGEYLVQSKICYDLMAVWRDMPRSGVDTLRLLDITGLTLPRLKNALYEARRSPRQGRLVAKYLSAEEKLQLDESQQGEHRRHHRQLSCPITGKQRNVDPQIIPTVGDGQRRRGHLHLVGSVIEAQDERAILGQRKHTAPGGVTAVSGKNTGQFIIDVILRSDKFIGVFNWIFNMPNVTFIILIIYFNI